MQCTLRQEQRPNVDPALIAADKERKHLEVQIREPTPVDFPRHQFLPQEVAAMPAGQACKKKKGIL